MEDKGWRGEKVVRKRRNMKGGGGGSEMERGQRKEIEMTKGGVRWVSEERGTEVREPRAENEGEMKGGGRRQLEEKSGK